ncbi:cytochrome-c peroxidase [Sphingobacterium griseoflavum]|nr:cytochrome c peroxidase [Sphingobacterium griseoflavum]
MRVFTIIIGFVLLLSCSKEMPEDPFVFENPLLDLSIPTGFPEFNPAVYGNRPTTYGVELGQRLFHEPRLSGNNTVSCASCHNSGHAFADNKAQAVGVEGRIGLRNTPPIQNMAFMKFYNWDGHMLQLEKQVLVPIITHEEMNSSILEVIGKLSADTAYRHLFKKAFGDELITAERIFKSIAQYEYTLISANSKYDSVMRMEGAAFTEEEERGHHIFKEKCASCHSTALFTDQSFRNVGFPLNPSTQEAGRARVTGAAADYMKFRVPSLRNIAYTAPYGSFGQFIDLRALLDYFDKGVLPADNLDPILKSNGNRIPLSEQEKTDIIAFLGTLSDPAFIHQ